MNYIFLNENNGVFYRKYPFDPGIQVWLVDVEEALATQISGASYPNDQLSHPYFLPSCRYLKLPGSSVSVDLLQSSLLRFTQCDPASAIIDTASSSSTEALWVNTLVFLGSPISPLKPKQPKCIATTDRGTNKEISGIEGTKRARTKGSRRYQ